MPRIIKNDADSYIMKNGVAYGDGLTGYIIKDGMYYGYMPNPAGSTGGGLYHWNWDDLPHSNYSQYTTTSSLDNFNIFHIMIFNGSSSTLTQELTPIHIVMSAELFNSSNIDNPIECTFPYQNSQTGEEYYRFRMYKVSSTSVAALRIGGTVGNLLYINFYGETT